jgi:transcriptional regulator with GAF, ATPase, and Fis domain
VLPSIDRIVVAHEVARTTPDLHALMARHKVAAIVRFHPHSRSAKAAEYLGLRPNTLHYKMQRYGLHNHNKSD